MSEPKVEVRSLEDLIRSAVGSDQEDKEPLSREEEIDLLKKGFDLIQQKNDFQPGDIVRFKPGMHNRKFPSKDSCAIIVEMIDPIEPDGEISSAYATEKLDCIVGVIEPNDNVFLMFYGSSQRLEKV